jgi:hypothetical protein
MEVLRSLVSIAGAGGSRRVRVALGALLAVTAFCALAATSAMAMKTPHVEIVRQGGPPEGVTIPSNTTYYTTIQAAVNATRKNAGDWVLIEPGTYTEEVLVTRAHSGIHIRGINRNTVILDGQHMAKPEGGSNGIYMYKANNVWVENLTVKNFDRSEADGEGGNEIWWAGAADTEKREGAHGWWGSYLTAYDTGQMGGYGIFAQHEKEGSWEHVYASGFNDSGLYIGACWECKAKVNDATIEDNAVGYSGSNSGGRLVIEKSIFRNNSAGIVPNGENPGDGPPPQNGICNAHRPRGPYYLFTSTNIEHCTVIKDNLVENNNNLEAPANPSTEKAPWGVGVELPGDMGDLVENNTIVNNVNNGVLGFEYPNPYPPQENTIYFQLTGNKIANNTFINNGTHGEHFNGDILLQGGLFPHGKFTSDNNCVSGNSFTGATWPKNIEGTWGCQNEHTPNPGNGSASLTYIENLSAESVFDRHATDYPEPPAQESMPEPCKGVPTTLCTE